MDWILYWILLYACWLGWLAAFSVFFILSHLLPSHFIAFHPISCSFIPYFLSCPFGRWNGSVLEYGSAAKEITERIKEDGGRWGIFKGNTREHEWLNQLASSVSSLRGSVAEKLIPQKSSPNKLDHFIYYPVTSWSGFTLFTTPLHPFY